MPSAQDPDTEFAALALLAVEMPTKGSRNFWMNQLDQLGQHLAPDLPPTHQRAAALNDPRGVAFTEALHQCAR
ncbi:hypothetical protein [Paracraurococcus lichenis]|uniref:Uncharacterized protein n=1 Tax=Paracraurococcus lichenis TaxID=3064888 RepID=A0ABT9EC34_9PROT|nr:hypothetical protein [Paracraurococcus sp. LOR1-02]MDO9713767.1 hypothetical protein [Paracraurococcus sp. LOR1-02]